MVSRKIVLCLPVLACLGCARTTAVTPPSVCTAAHSTGGPVHTGPEVARLTENRGATVQVTTGDDGHGTGFLVNHDGHLVTAYHVIEGETIIKVEVPVGDRIRQVYDATVVATLEDSDIAVLKIDGKFANATTFGDLAHIYRGDGIYTESYPLQYGPVLTRGYLMSERHTLTIGEKALGTVLLGHLPEAPGSSGSGAFSVRDGGLIGMLILSLDVSSKGGDEIFHMEVFIPSERIRMLLDAYQIPYTALSPSGAPTP